MLNARKFEERLADPDRLDALRASGLLDGLAEEVFDRAVRLATRVLDAPVSLLSIVDTDRQVFKAQIGLPESAASDRQTPLSHSFCQHVVADDEPLIVTNAREDRRVRDNLAIDDLGVVAYLGVPVHAPGGQPLGSFCVIASEPRDWTDGELETLNDIAAGVESEIDARIKTAKATLASQNFKAVLDSLPMGVAVAAMPSGEIGLINKRGADILAEIPSVQSEDDYRRFGAYHPDGRAYRPEDYPLLRSAKMGEVILDEPLLYRRPDNSLVNLEVSSAPMSEGGAGNAVCTFVDVTERNRARREADSLRDRLSHVLQATADAVFALDEDWRFTYLNDAAADFFETKGETDAELSGREIWDAFPDLVGSSLWAAFNDAADSGERKKIDHEDVQTGRCYEARVFPTDEDLTVFIRDVTAERHADATRQLLVRELNHRVKNLFAVLSGMIGMTSRVSRSPSEMADALRGRIYALARAHDLIRPAVTMEATENADVSLQGLVASLIEPHLRHEGDEIAIEGPVVSLGANGATSLALVLHELATNASKYGALSVPGGTLSVVWRVEAERVTLTWQEDKGPSIAKPPTKKGFGSTLVDMSVRTQLRGTAETEWSANGVRVSLTLPLARLQA